MNLLLYCRRRPARCSPASGHDEQSRSVETHTDTTVFTTETYVCENADGIIGTKKSLFWIINVVQITQHLDFCGLKRSPLLY